MTPALRRWNDLERQAAIGDVLPCNGSIAWAERLAHRRPFATEHDFLRAADAVWAELTDSDRQQAFDSHPRLGEREAKSATEQSLRHSAGEQSELSEDDQLKAALAEANREYERRFGRIFLLCASGKDTSTILRLLQVRLANDPQTEWREAAEQQRRITQLRLRKWLGLPAASCEDV